MKQPCLKKGGKKKEITPLLPPLPFGEGWGGVKSEAITPLISLN